jgi:adenylylsulfate kinase
MNHPGVTLWLTGLSGAGKSTLAGALAQELKALHLPVEILDGDELRRHLCKDLGFSREDRDTNVLRAGYVAGLLCRHGVFTLVALISPYADSRKAAQAQSERCIEIFVQAPLETVIERDTKGLYKKALQEEIPHFTGISDPYEAPVAPDIIVNTDTQSVDTCVAQVMTYLRDHQYIPAAALASTTEMQIHA